MAVDIRDGWLYGSLTDDNGKTWPIVRSPQSPSGAQNGSPVNLVLHTTETSGLVSKLQYPSNFQCGEGVIAQHIKLGFSGDAVWTYDRDCIGIEMVGFSRQALWLPGEATLGPTVALVAWLHRTGRIKTGTKRPYDWPDTLDRGPQAVTTYYRRSDPRKSAGIYGHVDLNGGNSHWDPGSFNYTAFIKRVEAALGEDEMTPEQQRTLEQAAKFLAALDDTIKADGPAEMGNRVGRAVKRSEDPAAGGDVAAHAADPAAHAHRHGVGKTDAPEALVG